MSSAAVVIGALRVEVKANFQRKQFCHFYASNLPFSSVGSNLKERNVCSKEKIYSLRPNKLIMCGSGYSLKNIRVGG